MTRHQLALALAAMLALFALLATVWFAGFGLTHGLHHDTFSFRKPWTMPVPVQRMQNHVTQARLQLANEQVGILKRDLDVAHQRITDLHEALNSVSKTQPGRDRTPFVPTRKRPDDSRRGDGQ